MKRERRNTIFVTTQFEALHHYPAAPNGVEFLRYPHRHMFHVQVEVEVFHDDREIEFILFKRDIEHCINNMNTDQKSRSCEMIANSIVDYVEENYPTGTDYSRYISVTVAEDGENGSTVRTI